MSQKRQLVIIDIDMTIADNTKRLMRYWDKKNKKILYDLFFTEKAIMTDRLIHGTRKALKTIRKNHDIIFLSARPKHTLTTTFAWLTKNKIIEKHKEMLLVDKPEGKLEILTKLQPRIFLYIDDLAYDYQSGKPKPMKELIEKIRVLGIPLFIFESNWEKVISDYFL